MLLELKYVTRERYARFAVLNTRQESGTQCTQDRASNDDDSIGEAAPPRFCLSEYVLRPTGRRNSQYIQEHVQTDGLLWVEAHSRL